VITLDNVSVTKGGRTILKNISLTIRGKRIGIIGHNGSGKSTFAKLLNGLEECSAGEIRYNSSPIADQKIRELVGFVFQNPDNQIVFPLVEEDIAFGLKKSGLIKSEIEVLVQEYLALFGLSHLNGRLTHELSGGEKQLIALIGVLIMKPQYIVLDEPTTLLDLQNRSMLIKTLKKLEQTLIIVSHDLELMMEMDHIYLIHNNVIFAAGDPKSIIQTYRNLSEC